jgi:hypothetical protein
MLCEPSLYSLWLQRIAQMVTACFVRLFGREVYITLHVAYFRELRISVQYGPYKLLNRAWIGPV